MEVRGIRLGEEAERKRRRLEEALAGRDPASLRLDEVVRDAQVLGSLELSGFAFDWETVRRARAGPGTAPEPIGRLQTAQSAVAPEAPFGAGALAAWHAAVTGSGAGLRAVERERPWGPPPAPAEFVASRLAILEEWIGGQSGRELKPAERGALVLARLVEIAPFEDANGRVARLAASHVIVAGGAEPPVLVGGDRPRLEAALRAAFNLETRPLVALLDEASERSYDVKLQALATPEGPAGP